MYYSLSLQTKVILPPNFLDSDASILYVHLAHTSTTKAPNPSRHVRAHTYIKQEVRILVPIFLCPRGLALLGTQIFLLAKLIEFTLS